MSMPSPFSGPEEAAADALARRSLSEALGNEVLREASRLLRMAPTSRHARRPAGDRLRWRRPGVAGMERCDSRGIDGMPGVGMSVPGGWAAVGGWVAGSALDVQGPREALRGWRQRLAFPGEPNAPNFGRGWAFNPMDSSNLAPHGSGGEGDYGQSGRWVGPGNWRFSEAGAFGPGYLGTAAGTRADGPRSAEDAREDGDAQRGGARLRCGAYGAPNAQRDALYLDGVAAQFGGQGASQFVRQTVEWGPAMELAALGQAAIGSTGAAGMTSGHFGDCGGLAGSTSSALDANGGWQAAGVKGSGLPAGGFRVQDGVSFQGLGPDRGWGPPHGGPAGLEAYAQTSQHSDPPNESDARAIGEAGGKRPAATVDGFARHSDIHDAARAAEGRHAAKYICGGRQAGNRHAAVDRAGIGVDGEIGMGENPRKARKQPPAKGERASPRSSKGLKQTSLRVMAAVKQQRRMSYTAVAEELVAEIASVARRESGEEFRDGSDNDNLRRRVYDVLNVLDAVGVIKKEEKQICWRGLPESIALLADQLRTEKAKLQEAVDEKRARLAQLAESFSALEGIVKRNEHRPIDRCPQDVRVLPLPCIIIRAPAVGAIEVQISEDLRSVRMNFHDVPFEVHDDIYVLKSMRLHVGAGLDPTGRGPGRRARARASPMCGSILQGFKGVFAAPMLLCADGEAGASDAIDSLDGILRPPPGGGRQGPGPRSPAADAKRAQDVASV
ncbi:unnamed protein product [Ostreobium quekettii]|uniref:Uncharacterized protein n=1 Tax=Ostreobium quekettii TaxID=121088 RepID=A0A8S1IR55_9CHLO|nr:unnamed protein product [Ostreobium quekettii]